MMMSQHQELVSTGQPAPPMSHLHTVETQEHCQKVVPPWIWNLHRQEDRVYSQSGEDGITETLIHHIAPIQKYYVEFGTEDATQCNTRILREKHQWTGLLMDGSHEDATINLHMETITPDNIVQLFTKHKVPEEPDYLSEDTDYADYWIWKSILEAKYRARIVVSEVNANFLPTESAAAHAPPHGQVRFWTDGNNYGGVSALALKRLWNKHGYLMVYCNFNQVNCWGIRVDLLPEIQNFTEVQDCLWRKPLAYHRKLHKKDQKGETYCWVDENGEISETQCDYAASFTGVDFHPWAKKSDPFFGE
jgi:hypothetical protein